MTDRNESLLADGLEEVVGGGLTEEELQQEKSFYKNDSNITRVNTITNGTGPAGEAFCVTAVTGKKMKGWNSLSMNVPGAAPFSS